MVRSVVRLVSMILENNARENLLLKMCRISVLVYVDEIEYNIRKKRVKKKGDLCMCDVKKYNLIFQDIKRLRPQDTLQLVLEAETEEERDFFEMIGNYLLQKEQAKVIERNLF